ncbi:MAG: hypothetical protein HYT87_05865 [Nitrospirae bacterium]|nr:hypothetical protein [Nitrospirota bacterium]
MQNKVGTVLEAGLVAKAKELAGRRGFTFSKVLESALSDYLRRERAASKGVSSVEATFGAIRLPPRAAVRLEAEDPYGSE